MRLTRREIEPLAPSYDGLVRVNHDSDHCHGDSDSLKIERRDGRVSAICFRCGARGGYALEHHYKSAPERTVSPAQEARAGELLPRDARGSGWPKEVLAWLAKSGLFPKQLAQYGAVWSEDKHTFYIPTRYYPPGLSGFEVTGYVCRRFNPKGYYTLRHRKKPLWSFVGGTRSGVVVLVEDVLSSLKVAAQGYDSIALCGTELHPEVVSWIVALQYRRAVVWLDADNPTVRMKSRKMQRKLAQLGVQVANIETKDDPKNATPEQIVNEVEKVLDSFSVELYFNSRL